MLVKGAAGGFHSLLSSDGLNAYLAERLGLEVLLVVADRLECINHVLLSVEAEPSPEKEKPKLKTKTYEKELGRLQIELVKLQE